MGGAGFEPAAGYSPSIDLGGEEVDRLEALQVTTHTRALTHTRAHQPGGMARPRIEAHQPHALQRRLDELTSACEHHFAATPSPPPKQQLPPPQSSPPPRSTRSVELAAAAAAAAAGSEPGAGRSKEGRAAEMAAEVAQRMSGGGSGSPVHVHVHLHS